MTGVGSEGSFHFFVEDILLPLNSLLCKGVNANTADLSKFASKCRVHSRLKAITQPGGQGMGQLLRSSYSIQEVRLSFLFVESMVL